MIIARFRQGTDRAGRTISYDGDTYVLEGQGPVGAHDVVALDAAGRLDWESPQARDFILASVAAPGGGPAAAAAAAGQAATRPAGMLVAVFGPSTAWVGRRITCRNDVFTLEGHGPVSAAAVMDYDRQGHLRWESESIRIWVRAKVQPAAPASATGGGAAPWWRRRGVLPALVGVAVAVIVLAVVLVAVQARSASRTKALAAAARVVQPFRKLDSALDVGVDFQEYGRLVRDAQFALDSYHPQDETGLDVAAHLREAAEAYRVANEAWNDDIQDEFVGEASLWNGMCPALKLPTGYVTPDDVRQAAWVVGAAEVVQASRLAGVSAGMSGGSAGDPGI